MTTVRQLVLTTLSVELQQYQDEWEKAIAVSFKEDDEDGEHRSMAYLVVNQAVNSMVVVVGDLLLFDPQLYSDRDKLVRQTWHMLTTLPSSFERMLRTARARHWLRRYSGKGGANVERN